MASSLTPAEVVATLSSKDGAMTPAELVQTLAAEGWPVAELSDSEETRVLATVDGPDAKEWWQE